MAKYEDKFQELTHKVEVLQAKSMRTELIIFGLQDKQNKIAPKEVTKDFFKNQMMMTDPIDILHAFWKGKSQNKFKPLVVRLSSAAARNSVYKHASNLKDKTNEKGRSYKIEDHLPDSMTAHQRRQGQIFAANKAALEGQKTPMDLQKGKLTVNGAPYSTKIDTDTFKTAAEPQ